MTWVILRQNRLSLTVWTFVVLAVGTYALVVGLLLWREIDSQQLYDCFAHPAASPRCDVLFGELARTFNRSDRLIFPALLGLPLLLGVFGAAPLAATDLEQLTYKFIWTQGVTPRRWLASRIVLGIAIAIASSVVLTAMTWPWLLLTQEMALGWSRFAEFPLALLGSFVVATALGLAAGIALGRAIPAAIAALAGFVGVRLAFELWLRQTLLPPLSQDNLLVRRDVRDWFVGLRYYDAGGHEVPTATIQAIQLSTSDPSGTMAKEGIRVVGFYQPWERFSTFQMIESAAYLALAFIAIALTFWWIERARS